MEEDIGHYHGWVWHSLYEGQVNGTLVLGQNFPESGYRIGEGGRGRTSVEP